MTLHNIIFLLLGANLATLIFNLQTGAPTLHIIINVSAIAFLSIELWLHR